MWRARLRGAAEGDCDGADAAETGKGTAADMRRERRLIIETPAASLT